MATNSRPSHTAVKGLGVLLLCFWDDLQRNVSIFNNVSSRTAPHTCDSEAMPSQLDTATHLNTLNITGIAGFIPATHNTVITKVVTSHSGIIVYSLAGAADEVIALQLSET